MQNSNIEVSYKFFVSYSLDLFLKGKRSVFCFSVFLYIVCLYFAGLDFLRERTISTTSRSWLQKWVATTQAKRSNSSMSWYLGLTYLGIRLDFCVEWLREWKIYSMSRIRYLAFQKISLSTTSFCCLKLNTYSRKQVSAAGDVRYKWYLLALPLLALFFTCKHLLLFPFTNRNFDRSLISRRQTFCWVYIKILTKTEEVHVPMYKNPLTPLDFEPPHLPIIQVSINPLKIWCPLECRFHCNYRNNLDLESSPSRAH